MAMFSYSVFHTLSPITESLYLSSGAAASSATNLRIKGITFVVNATLSPTKIPTGLNIRSMQVPVDDVPHALLSPYFERVADKIREEKLRGGRTVVHCVAGVSRSASLCIAYLMKHESLTLREAYEYVKGRRAVIRPNWGFWKQLISYEFRLFGRNTVHMVPSPVGWIPDVYEKQVKNMVW
ncbi:dual specificity protein phosphatase 18-like [Ptychodera flava]|uniref:dual specificity protein phosphatase 18-like n=1 Tax=Ptychodera flava TaxID=63121 RepID=UPI00396A4E85